MFTFQTAGTQRLVALVGTSIFRRIHTVKMPLKFAANISMLFPEKNSLTDRYEQAHKFGFKLVECTYPYGEPLDKLIDAKQKFGLEYVLMNSYIGNLI